MNIMDFGFENWYTVLLRFNYLAVLIFIASLVGISYLIKRIAKYANRKSIIIEEINLGIGNSSVKLTYSKKDQEIAYKLWVELSTRKIGIPYDKENDVISDVYDSWYAFFGIARELLKEIPADRIEYSNKLIDLTENVLNLGLRPHLTVWQAKYRKWYENEQIDNRDKSPQETQSRYPEYNKLIEDLTETNKHMVNYMNLMHQIAFGS